MTDVLIVCVREDEIQAKALADMFERDGFSVGGAPADDAALRECGAVVVIWSQASIRSRPFLDASQRVVNAGKAVLACLIEPPPASSLNQSPAFDLRGWRGDSEDPVLDPLYFAVDRMAQRRSGAAPQQDYAPPPAQPAYAPQPQAYPPRARPMAQQAYEPQAYEPPPPEPARLRRAAHAAAPAETDQLSAEALRWRAIRHSRDPAAFLHYLAEYGPEGEFSELAELRLKKLQEANATPLRAAAKQVAAEAAPRARAPEPPPPRREIYREPEPRLREPERYREPPPARAPERDYRDYRTPERSTGGGGAARFMILALLLGGGALGAGMYFGNGQRLPSIAGLDASAIDAPPADAAANIADDSDGAALSDVAAAPANAVGGPTRIEEETFDQPARPAERASDRSAERAAAVPQFQPLGGAADNVPIPLPQPIGPGPQQMAALQPAPAAPAIANPGNVVWTARPSASQFGSAYPANARDNDIGGRVQLTCIIGADYRPACNVLSETPSGYGFADAALRVVRGYRARATLDDGNSSIGSRATLNVNFQPATSTGR